MHTPTWNTKQKVAKRELLYFLSARDLYSLGKCVSGGICSAGIAPYGASSGVAFSGAFYFVCIRQGAHTHTIHILLHVLFYLQTLHT